MWAVGKTEQSKQSARRVSMTPTAETLAALRCAQRADQRHITAYVAADQCHGVS